MGNRKPKKLASDPDDRSVDGKLPSGSLDELDYSIIAQLQQDGRRSYRAMARALKVPEATVRFRARRLQDQGTLRILAFSDPHELGYQVSALVLLKVPPAARSQVIDAVADWPEVMWLSSCAGAADLFMHVVCRDHHGLLRLVTDRLGSTDSVHSTEILMELEIHKARYLYPGIASVVGDSAD